MPAPAQGGLLDSAADLVQRLAAKFDDVKCVESRGRLVEMVVDGVGVAAERVQGGDLHPGAELPAAACQPVPEHLPGAPRDQVQEPGAGASVLVTAQIHHPGEHRGALVSRAVRGVVPHVLINAEGGDAVEAGLVASQLGQARLDHPPERVPGDTELAGQAFDGGVGAADPRCLHRVLHRGNQRLLICVVDRCQVPATCCASIAGGCKRGDFVVERHITVAAIGIACKTIAANEQRQFEFVAKFVEAESERQREAIDKIVTPQR